MAGPLTFAEFETASGQRSVKAKGDVVAYELIPVPAGSFMAFKVLVTLDGTRWRESWWEPEARMAVRTTISDGKGGQIRAELLDYARSNAEDAALVLLFSLVASGQIKLRRIDGWQKVAAVSSQHTAVAA